MEKYTDQYSIGTLYEEPPKIVNFVSPSRLPLIFASLGVLAFLLIVLPSFLQCYNERAQKFSRHREYLVDSGLCDNFLRNTLLKNGDISRADILANIYVEKARYHDIETNCEKAYLFIQQSKLFGAIDDWFVNSTLYILLTAGNWKLQLIFMAAFVIAVRCFFNYLLRMNAVNQVAGAIKSENYAVVFEQ